MEPHISLETARLILRTVTHNDCVQVAQSWNIPDETPLALQEATDKILWMHANHTLNRRGDIRHVCLAIIVRDTHEFIGWCGLDHVKRTRPYPELFYLLKRRHWGQGLATEAARAVVTYAFEELGLTAVRGSTDAENLASQRVMEKIGMRATGRTDDGGYAFLLTHEDFAANQHTF